MLKAILFGVLLAVPVSFSPAGRVLAETRPGDAGLSKSIDVEVIGRVSQACGLGAGRALDIGDLNAAGGAARTSVPFVCNVPFALKLSSDRGGFALPGAALDTGPYASKRDYRLTVAVPVRTMSQASVLARTVDSRELEGVGVRLDSGQSIAAGPLDIQVDLAPGLQNSMRAGRFRDNIALTVTPL